MAIASANGTTEVLIGKMLLAGTTSVCPPETATSASIVPGEVGVPRTVIVAGGKPLPNEPRLHTTWFETAAQLPSVVEAEMKFIPCGRTFVSTTPVAMDGPLFITRMV